MGYFDRFNNKGIPFMDNADKGDLHDILGKPVRIEDFGFIKKDGEEGDYGVISLTETLGVFYFCNQVVTDMLHQVEKDDMKEELANQYIVFSEATSKKGRDYIRFEFTKDNIPF